MSEAKATKWVNDDRSRYAFGMMIWKGMMVTEEERKEEKRCREEIL